VRRLETELRAHARAAHDAALKLDEVTLRLTEEARGATATRKEAEAREEVCVAPGALHAACSCLARRARHRRFSNPLPRVSNLLEISRSVSMNRVLLKRI
jgi:hypothetical protein